MLDKIERVERPTEHTQMHFHLEPRIVSGNDVLTITGLRKAFDKLTLFTDLNFDIKRGEKVAIIGNNGTGKTTILKIINGQVDADGGEIRLGTKVHIGYYDQEHQVLDPEKTLFDELQDTYPHLDNTTIRNILAAFLFTEDDVFKRIKDISGGERGRVSLAKLMLSEANLLILDEPVSALDVSIRAQVINLFESLQRELGLTYLFVAHDLSIVRHVSNRIAVMYLGKIVEIGTRQEVYESPTHPYTQALLSAVPIESPQQRGLRKRIVLEGDVPNPANPPSGCRFRTRCWKAQQICAEVEPPLENRGFGHPSACHFPEALDPFKMTEKVAIRMNAPVADTDAVA
jgi:ATP-binding cassette subfamily F protein 3